MGDRPGQGFVSICELCAVFLRLGLTAFGGPAAHIAMMRSEFVDRCTWLTEAEFLDLVGASNLIPGPSSTELAIFIGLRRAGWIGLLAAGICFILPAALIVTAIAWAYVRFGHLPQAAGMLYGVKPVIIAVIAQALWTLGRAALKTGFLIAVALIALGLCVLGVSPIVLLFGVGLLAGLRGWLADKNAQGAAPLAALIVVVGLLLGLPALLTAVQPPVSSAAAPLPLLLVFAKIGSVVFGSGYVLLAFLKTDLISRLHWLSSSRLLDAVAVGQFTPGPVFTTATFIGYVLAGPAGAVAATIGIFLPAFLFVAVSAPLVPRIRRYATAAGFLDGVNAAVLALMAFVAWQLARAALINGLALGIFAVALVLLFRWRVNSVWLVAAGALTGLVCR